MDRGGAFAAPAVFELLHDRVAANYFPSRRLVISAALSARTVDQLDRLLATLSRQARCVHLSPRNTELLGLVAERRAYLDATRELVGSDDEDVDASDLHDAVEMLKTTTRLLD